MKSIQIATSVALAILAAVPASAGSFGFTARPHVRGIPVHRPIFDTLKIRTPVRIIGIVVRPTYPIRGLVINRPMGGLNGPLVRGVPVDRRF